jgi:Carboxymuconolactone decarboxylase family
VTLVATEARRGQNRAITSGIQAMLISRLGRTPTRPPEAMEALVALESYVHESGLNHSLIDLVKTRASQINGCAYCIHMHNQNRSVGAGCRRPSGSRLDGAGRRTGIDALARPCASSGSFVPKRCDRLSPDAKIR